MDLDNIHTHRHFPKFFGLGMLVLAVGIFIFAAYYRPKKAPPTTIESTPVLRVVSTPIEYQDFTGTISSVSPSLTVTASLTKPDGTSQEKVYTVQTTASTIIRVLRRVDGQAAYTTIKQSDLRVDQRVQVYADHNVADETALTATKIDQLDL